MPRRLIGFEERTEPLEGEEHIGKWVIISNSSNTQSFAGYLKRISGENYVLNPSQGIDYSPEIPMRGLLKRDEFVPFKIAGPIEYTTEKSIQGLCDKRNEQERKTREDQKIR